MSENNMADDVKRPVSVNHDQILQMYHIGWH